MNISVDGSLGIQILNFVVLIVVLNVVLYKPIRGILAKRRQTVEGLESSISRMRSEGDACLEAVKAGIKEARTSGVREKDAVVERVSAEEKKRIAEIQEGIQKDLEAFRVRIAAEAEEARKALTSRADVFASAIAEKILGRAI
ncbi:ATPase [Desulfobotulus sp. H1]|uniref:ATP synthase subunit b n=1 Tax=Desulfobotulus pelophilus TaxID=2823377 RepID=A0ABT3NCA6_9BACT|nr:ATPase [Desulfobotulus pelophilus]MCW7755094.1 ATPase [Desulfobotulus pelophilus]